MTKKESEFMKKAVLRTTLVLAAVAFIGAFSCPAMAKVTGVCSGCHTMHDSQGGTAMATGGPHATLLMNSCVGCHSRGDSTTTYILGGCEVPVVNYTGGSEPTEYLAGGNFWWVQTEGGTNMSDAKGHNIFSDNPDTLLKAPGGLECGNDSCHENLDRAYSGSAYGFGGRYACEGCHLAPAHHANDHANGASGLVNTADQGWYRFLSGHAGGVNNGGVHGYEDGDWEAGQPNLSLGQLDNHNEYLGAESRHANTTTAYCTGCHGQFHEQQLSGKWVRHPSDAVIKNEGEYAYTGRTAGDENAHLYDPLSPVASPSVDGEPDGTVTPGTDFVMCLSCHRPHGSPYADILRWDYGEMLAGGGDNYEGCFYCHTKKDTGG